MADRRRLFRPTPLTRVGKNGRPWCKENLPSQFSTKHENRQLHPTFMNTQRWVFVKKGLDDFRLSAAQQARKAFLEEIEAQLTRHPLARYPDLEESLPLELLKRVLQVLDPDKKLEDAWARCEGVEKKTKEPTKLLEKRPTRASLGLPKRTPLSKKPRQSLSEEKPSAKDSLHKDGPTPNENIRKSVRDFCDWAASIGSSRIDEEYIMKQFDINYERGVSHDTLRPVKLSEIPGELRKGDGLRKQQESEFFQELEPEPKNTSRPKHVKMRYGSWYQHPKLWKRQRADEPLIDPKALYKDENLREEQKKQEEEFAKLHGPAAFKDFILRKGYRMPSFLENINTKKECNCNCKKTPRK